jgi:hypothetical protein
VFRKSTRSTSPTTADFRLLIGAQHSPRRHQFELQDGQSFVIAGLMDNRVTSIMNKIPGRATFRSGQSVQEQKLSENQANSWCSAP